MFAEKFPEESRLQTPPQSRIDDWWSKSHPQNRIVGYTLQEINLSPW